jgi:hypothetical protein
VGRSTSSWALGSELALLGCTVRIEDLDQGAHLSRTFDQYPLGLDRLQLASAGVKMTMTTWCSSTPRPTLTKRLFAPPVSPT